MNVPSDSPEPEMFAELVPAIRAKLGRDDVSASDVSGWGTHFHDVRRWQPRGHFVLYLERESYVSLPRKFKPTPKIESDIQA
jgi:hypothetical protein